MLAILAIENTGARWAAVVRCSVEKRRVVWRLSVYDGLDGALIAADTQAAFAGLSALSLMDESATAVSAMAATLRNREVPGAPIDYRIRLVSTDEGAAVAFGSGESARQIGMIADGGLLTPYVAFVEDQQVMVSLSKDGYWPRETLIRPGRSDEPIELKSMMLMTRHALSLFITNGRILGLSTDYRYHLYPDGLYLRMANSAWVQGDDNGFPVLHDEPRLGVGAYLLMPPDSRFRTTIGTGISGIVTLLTASDFEDQLYLDSSLDIVWLTLEWHWPRIAIVFEERFSYALGSDTGLLRRGWWGSDGSLVLMSLGVMFKWP
ncbi:MAG: hypothetical protein JXM71_10735, partial [Spirochaetales bacterium]|nr:hypothetical protein [Spirochaetales bacterium]